MSDATGVRAQTHLAAHLLREIDGRVRDALQPMLGGGADGDPGGGRQPDSLHAEGTANKRVQIAVEE
jgi:hypothetical protein